MKPFESKMCLVLKWDFPFECCNYEVVMNLLGTMLIYDTAMWHFFEKTQI